MHKLKLYEPVVFWISGRIPPKKRPRTNKKTGAIYMPPTYMEWKNLTSAYFWREWGGRPKITIAHVICIIQGQQLGDIDNITGSLLDALVQAEVMIDDLIHNIPDLHSIWKPQEPQGAELIIKPLEFEPEYYNNDECTDYPNLISANPF